MHVRTDKYGTTTITGAPVAQAPTLESRVTKAMEEEYAIRSPRVHAQACALVKAHPSLTARQAVAFVVDSLFHTDVPA